MTKLSTRTHAIQRTNLMQLNGPGKNDDGSTIFIQTASIINAYDESYNGKRMCS